MVLSFVRVVAVQASRGPDRLAHTALLIGLATLLFGLSGFTLPYREEAVVNGATIGGVVTVQGAIPEPLRYKVTMGSNPEFCRRIADERGQVSVPQAIVSGKGELRGAVVFLQEVGSGKPVSKDGPLVTVDGCRFDRLVLAAVYGQSLRVEMKDTIVHQIRGWEMIGTRRLPLFQLPPLDAGHVRAAPLETRRSSIVKLECDQHRFMQAWVLLVANPYVTVSDAHGRFELGDIPPGTYAVGAWHPVLGYEESTVTVQAGDRAAVSFRLTAPGP